MAAIGLFFIVLFFFFFFNCKAQLKALVGLELYKNVRLETNLEKPLKPENGGDGRSVRQRVGSGTT